MISTKICGITEPAALEAAVSAGATYVGFNFFAPSVRFIAPALAGPLAASVPPGVAKVAVTVDAGDAELDAIVDTCPLDMIQLHGQESPARIAEIRARYGLPVIRAVQVATAQDIATLPPLERAADQILLDAKAPKGSVIPGGHGVAFDWQLVAGHRFAIPWILAGGLTPETVANAIRLTHAKQVDVASGVEAPKGVKDPGLIAAFIAAAQGGSTAPPKL